MSGILDAILAQAANGQEATVTLSAESVAVLLFGTGFLEKRKNWLDPSEFPGDEITVADWDEIERLVANLVFEVSNPVEVAMIPVGAIMRFGVSSPPAKWLECNGASVPIADYPLLFAAIGENFGFSVGGNFVLPNAKFRSAVGLGTLDYDPTFEIALGERVGSAKIALGIGNVPPHTHPPPSPFNSYTGNRGSGGTATFPSGTPIGSFAQTGSAGGVGGVAEPFQIIPPVIGLLTCIYAGE